MAATREAKRAEGSSAAAGQGLTVDGLVAFGGAAPGEVKLHASRLKAMPLVRALEGGQGAAQGGQQRPWGVFVEYETVTLTVGAGVVADGVGQAAGVAHHGDGAVAQGDELAQAAGLEARGHEEQVAAAVDELRQRMDDGR